MTRAGSKKLLRDAGEHYALSRFSFAGRYAAKMPDNWEGYDPAVETGEGLVRVSVKTRSETDGWPTSRWFLFDDRRECDWLVLIFKPREGALRAWVMPFGVALANANQPGAQRKNPWERDISWAKLNRVPLAGYEDNWAMRRDGAATGE